MTGYKILGLRFKYIRQLFIRPTGSLTPTHKTDPPDPIDNGSVMPLPRRRLHFQQLRMLLARRIIPYLLFIIFTDRITAVQGHYPFIFYEYRRHAVRRSGKKEGIVETCLVRAGFYFTIPIGFSSISQAQMPFADSSRRISRALKDIRQGTPIGRDDQGSISGEDVRPLLTPCIFACKERITGRCAGRRRRMPVRKLQALFSQPVDVRCMDLCSAITAYIAISQVVRI